MTRERRRYYVTMGDCPEEEADDDAHLEIETNQGPARAAEFFVEDLHADIGRPDEVVVKVKYAGSAGWERYRVKVAMEPRGSAVALGPEGDENAGQ